MAEALGAFGPEAEAAVPDLARAARGASESMTRVLAAEALGKVGPGARTAIPALLEAVKDPEVRDTAAEALGKPGEQGIRALVQLLENDDAYVRESAAEATGKAGPAASIATGALTRALKDREGFVQDAAAGALKAIQGSQARGEVSGADDGER